MEKTGKGAGRKGVRERGEAAGRMWALRELLKIYVLQLNLTSKHPS